MEYKIIQRIPAFVNCSKTIETQDAIAKLQEQIDQHNAELEELEKPKTVETTVSVPKEELIDIQDLKKKLISTSYMSHKFSVEFEVIHCVQPVLHRSQELLRGHISQSKVVSFSGISPNIAEAISRAFENRNFPTDIVPHGLSAPYFNQEEFAKEHFALVQSKIDKFDVAKKEFMEKHGLSDHQFNILIEMEP